MDLYLIVPKREWEQVKDLEFYGEEVLKHEEFIRLGIYRREWSCDRWSTWRPDRKRSQNWILL